MAYAGLLPLGGDHRSAIRGYRPAWRLRSTRRLLAHEQTAGGQRLDLAPDCRFIHRQFLRERGKGA